MNFSIKKYLIAVTFVSSMVAAEKENLPAEPNDDSQAITLSVAPSQYEKMKVLLGLMGNCSQELLEVAGIIKKDLEFSGQFQVTVRTVSDMHAKKEITQLCVDGFALAIFVDSAKDGNIEWRVYDTAQVQMLKGEKYTKRGSAVRGWAHNVADALWPTLTGQEGFFSTKIAYCKDVRQAKKRKVKYVCVADYDGTNEQVLVNAPTVNIAPRWNNDTHNPLLFYSDYTNSNVRLIAVNMKKQRKIASNFDGINMLPAFSTDGKRVVYCASKGKGNCQLYYYENSQVTQITKNAGNNVSPTFAGDKNIIFFCSDFQTGQPQVYCYDISTKALQRITDGGYCASPSYCSKNGKLVYSKKIQGIMQLMVYDVSTKQHVQLTNNGGHKEECSWSPCGNFVLYSVENNSKSRIAQLNILTHEQTFITAESAVCTYPAWSPRYEQFVLVS